MADFQGVVQCPKCEQYFDGPVAHHNHYVEHYTTKKGQHILDRVTCGDPGPISRYVTVDGREYRIHGGRRPA